MKKMAILSLILSGGLVASSQSNQTTDNPQLLKDALTGYFTGIENKDTAKMRAVTTDDFILYEDGRIWNNDSAFMNIRRNLPFTVKYTMDNFKIYVDSKSGDMTYVNHADFVFGKDSKLSLDWIESASFRKIDGIWKINFLAATLRK
jgi:hypothetical protein